MREHDKKYRYLVDGRSPMNMSDVKYTEYLKLLHYINLGLKPHFGYCVALHRFYKNLKYRKRYIILYKKTQNSGK